MSGVFSPCILMDSGISLWVLESMELFFRMPDVNPAHGVLDF